ncbi:MAG: hypothetical protein WCY09_07965 [Candidatus Omnitrophota bacterium]
MSGERETQQAPPWLRLYIGGPQDGTSLTGAGDEEPPVMVGYREMLAVTIDGLLVKFLVYKADGSPAVYREAWERVAGAYVRAKAAGRCKTCKWYVDTFRTRKACEMLGDDDPQRTDQLVYSYDEGGAMLPGPDFGCVHWEPRV